MPWHEIGHLNRVGRIRARAAQLRVDLAGNASEGVALPDGICSGECAVETIFEA